MEIIYEDNHIVAVNKQVSDIIQGDKTGDEPLSEEVKRYIAQKHNKPGNVFLGVVHRIDRPVSGVVLFARTSKALSRLNDLIKERKIKKTYWAIVKNAPPTQSAAIKHYLVRDTQKNKSFAHDREVPNSQLAVLSYEIIAQNHPYYYLRIDLQTGRHHQIRCQLAQIGCPIVGDLKYGSDRPDNNGGIHLHARQLEFIHPVAKTPITITANPPQDPLWNDFILK